MFALSFFFSKLIWGRCLVQFQFQIPQTVPFYFPIFVFSPEIIQLQWLVLFVTEYLQFEIACLYTVIYSRSKHTHQTQLEARLDLINLKLFVSFFFFFYDYIVVLLFSPLLFDGLCRYMKIARWKFLNAQKCRVYSPPQFDMRVSSSSFQVIIFFFFAELELFFFFFSFLSRSFLTCLDCPLKNVVSPPWKHQEKRCIFTITKRRRRT